MKRRPPMESNQNNFDFVNTSPPFASLIKFSPPRNDTCPSSVGVSPPRTHPRPYFPPTLVSPVAIREPETKSSPALKSVLKPNKRQKLLKYRNCTDIVDPQLDSSVSSDYECLLFTNMTMVTRPNPCFRCRLCPPSPSTTFECKSLRDLEDAVPKLEKHLLKDCPGTPEWLAPEITHTKTTHASQSCPRKPYLNLVWKRVQAHAVYNRAQTVTRKKRVQFSETLCRERLIPGRGSHDDFWVLGRCC